MDISRTIIPNSEQVNADDLVSGPITVTVTSVEEGTSEQPAFIHLAEIQGRTYRPNKTMRKILNAAWGKDTDAYTGRRMTLFRNGEVRFGREAVGGVQISHLSHIAKPLTLALATTRGKRAPFVVQPLADAPAAPDPSAHITAINTATNEAELRTAWESAVAAGVSTNPQIRALTNRRKAELAEETNA